MSLTARAVQNLVRNDGQQSDPSFLPTVQIIKLIKVGNANGDRYRAVLSDGHNFVQGMLATQLNGLVTSGQIADNTIVRVRDYMNNLIQDRNVIILLGIDIVSTPGSKVGEPTDVELILKQQGGVQPAAKPLYNNTNTMSAPNNSYGGAAVKPEGRSAGNPYGGNSSGAANPYGGSRSMGGGSAPIARISGASNVTPIAQLNLYMSRWTIRARCTSKSDVKHWSNARGEGSLFSIEMLDSSGTDIRATFFKEAVDKFYSMLEVDRVYTFSGGKLKVANMQYNTCKSQCEITFDQNAEIHLENDTGDIQQQIFEFVRIADLESVEPNKYVDVIGVVKSVGQVGTIVSKKSGNELTKCELMLADDSGAEVSLTLWGEKANSAASEYGATPVVAFRKARVSDFGGRSLSAGQSISVQPRIADTERLRAWWQSGGSSTAAKSLSQRGGGAGRVPAFDERKNIAAIKNEHLGQNNPDKPDWISFKGRFNFLKKDKEGGAWYTACANSEEPCKNRYKVTQTADGNWYCEKCQQTNPGCTRRFIFSGTVADDSCTTWVSLFNEQAESLFGGIKADDLYRECFEAELNDDKYNSTFAKANFREYLFTCKVKQEMVGDEARVKTSVYSMHPVDHASESRILLEKLAAM
jgi:replication factor A1